MQTNDRLIQPIPSYDGNDTVQLNIFRMYNFRDYDFNGGGGTVDFVIGLYQDDNFVPKINGSCPIPAEIVASWGSDDSVIFSYVMAQKNLTPITGSN